MIVDFCGKSWFDARVSFFCLAVRILLKGLQNRAMRCQNTPFVCATMTMTWKWRLRVSMHLSPVLAPKVWQM
jgi:hypothetical protein